MSKKETLYKLHQRGFGAAAVINGKTMERTPFINFDDTEIDRFSFNVPMSTTGYVAIELNVRGTMIWAHYEKGIKSLLNSSTLTNKVLITNETSGRPILVFRPADPLQFNIDWERSRTIQLKELSLSYDIEMTEDECLKLLSLEPLDDDSFREFEKVVNTILEVDPNSNWTSSNLNFAGLFGRDWQTVQGDYFFTAKPRSTRLSFEVLVIWNQLAIVISDEFGVGSVLTYNELETFLSESKPVETLDNINNDSKYPFRVANPNEYNFDSVAYQSKHLFGGLWHHNELCILFGPTNVGKSVLSVQIGVNIALGGAIFNGELDCFEAQKVLYVDFELSEKQFKSRYGNFVFPPNFFRAELDFNHPEAGVNRLSLIDCLTSLVREHDAQVLIIDNLSAIQSDNTQASEAAKLIQAFNAMKRALSISILLVGHTTKHNRQLPLELNNLAGSAQMANLIDSSFAIGKSHPKGLYVKQLKQRNEEQKYGESSVINANIENGSNGELIFNFEGFSEESKLLAPSQVIREERNSQIRELYARGLTQAQIGKELGIGKSTVGDVLRQSQSNGEQNSTNDLPF